MLLSTGTSEIVKYRYQVRTGAGTAKYTNALVGYKLSYFLTMLSIGVSDPTIITVVLAAQLFSLRLWLLIVWLAWTVYFLPKCNITLAMFLCLEVMLMHADYLCYMCLACFLMCLTNVRFLYFPFSFQEWGIQMKNHQAMLYRQVFTT